MISSPGAHMHQTQSCSFALCNSEKINSVFSENATIISVQESPKSYRVQNWKAPQLNRFVSTIAIVHLLEIMYVIITAIPAEYHYT